MLLHFSSSNTFREQLVVNVDIQSEHDIDDESSNYVAKRAKATGSDEDSFESSMHDKGGDALYSSDKLETAKKGSNTKLQKARANISHDVHSQIVNADEADACEMTDEYKGTTGNI